jgi:energy-coupling factor transporter ATP-binding protein EcfA2
MLIIGSTGSGKTTLITGAIRQLLQHRIGLLILDAKQEGLVEEITKLAARSGRSDDLAILGPDGTHALDVFGSLRTYDDVEAVAQWLMTSADTINDSNPYWRNTTSGMISAALTLLVRQRSRRRKGRLPHCPGIKFREAIEFMRDWFLSLEGSDSARRANGMIERGKRQSAKRAACPQLLGALDHAGVWKVLDSRTRSNLQSCLLLVLKPLLSSAATRSFDTTGKPIFQPAQVATQNKICVVSANALTQPDLARFLLRLARRQFFDAVQSRGPGEHPYCGLVADELPLIIEREDADQLSTIRSRNCFVLAATQGLASLDERVGLRRRCAILLNFNTLVFMRTREQETGEFATLTLGNREPPPAPKPKEGWEDSVVKVLSPRSDSKWQDKRVAPPGALGRLQPHQAYVVKCDGSRSPSPLWFVPWFDMESVSPPVIQVSPNRQFSAKHVEQLLRRHGIDQVLSKETLEAAFTLDAPMHPHFLTRAREFFLSAVGSIPDGLEALPASWLAGLPGILCSMRQPPWPQVPCRIQRVDCSDGALLLSFAQEPASDDNDRLTDWDQIRMNVNRSIYPSRWRPLLRRHRLELAQRELGRDSPGLDLA